MQLLMIRHGLPLRSVENADPPLADLGVEQALRVPAAIARHKIVRVVSSPQQRARLTAAPTAERLGLAVDIVDDLAEYDHTIGAYIPIEDAKVEFREAYERIKAGELPEFVDPAAFKKRVIDAVGAIVAAAEHTDTVVAFAHGGVINSYLQNVLGNAKTLAFPIEYCSVTRILFSRDGRRTVSAVNETEHVWDLLPRNQ
ncbi:histidine phosphatase family protein [Antrihabitans spumae]|uniref:Histidine phosphatase family protein n=1 Tax=Antrihabitans spumae TaxID=3373370 RepID=A0ABW7JTR6_9NOCA